MRKSIIFLLSFLAVSLLLVACSENKEDVANVNNEEMKASVSSDEKEEGEDPEDEANIAEEVEVEEDIPSDVKGIFQKVAEVMSGVQGMALTGEIHSTTDMMGITDEEVTTVSGKVSMDPLAQYLRMDTESDLDGARNMEMYVTKEAMYMSDPESGGWFSLSMEQGGMMGDLSAIVTESHMQMLSELDDLFELTEDGDHFIVTFEGSGEDYKNIAYGGLKDVAGDEAYDDLTAMITEVSGRYAMTIDKDSFYVVAMEMDSEQTMDMGFGEVHSTEEISYLYSEFNEVEDVTVPNDVMENAKNFDMSGVMNGN